MSVAVQADSPIALDNVAGPVGVGSFADREGYTVAEEIALTDAKVRGHVSYAIAAAFVLTNVLTLVGVGYIFGADNANIIAHVMESKDRVITPRVVMTIIGATTVQLGSLALIMGKYLFPATPKPPLLQRILGR